MKRTKSISDLDDAAGAQAAPSRPDDGTTFLSGEAPCVGQVGTVEAALAGGHLTAQTVLAP
jgi:hypothetical protein